MKLLAAFAALWWLSAATAAAQTNPIVANYRAYQAALERGDLAAAETAAAAALAASEARDGDGGSTAVLALNLATLRLDAGRRAEALEPARRARALASAGRGVDPSLAELILGRAELSQTPYTAGEARIRAVLDAQGAAVGAHGYDAAVDLGQFLSDQRRYADAVGVWSRAVELAPGEGFAGDYARARAFIGLGGASTLNSTVRGEVSDTPRAGTFVEERVDLGPEQAAWTAFENAMSRMAPHLGPSAPGEDITLAQQGYSMALAWRTGLAARMRSQGLARPESHGDGRLLSNAPGVQACAARVDGTEPRTPPQLVRRAQVASVVLRLITDASGAVVDARIAGHVGDRAFAESYEAAAAQWRVVRDGGQAAGCTMAMTILAPYALYYTD